MKRQKTSKIRVLLVDDHPLVLEGVRSSLLKHDHFEIVGEASNGAEAVRRARQSSPDVIVMDITMPGMSGLEATKCLRATCPQSRVLIMTVHDKKEFVREMIQSGARGYVRKSTSPAEFVSAIESVHRGELFFKPDLAQEFFKDYVLNGGKVESRSTRQLSKREQQILDSVVEGLANKEIAARFSLSVRTVEKHRQRMMRKLGIHKATELVKFALTRGTVNLNLL